MRIAILKGLTAALALCFIAQAASDTNRADVCAKPFLHAEFEHRVLILGQTNSPAADAVRRVKFWRTDDTVARLTPESNEGEIWRRVASNQFSYVKLFLEEKRAIEYTDGDLRALNQQVNWERLAHLVDPAELPQKFEVTGSATFKQYRVIKHRERGEDEHSLEVWWIPELQIPARLVEYHEDATHEFVLLKVETSPGATESMPDATGYRRMDFADVGDNENDPFIRRFIDMGGLPGHADHH